MGRAPGSGAHNLDPGARRFAIFAIALGVAAVVVSLPFLVQAHRELQAQALPLAIFAAFIALSWFFSFLLPPVDMCTISQT